MIREQMARPAQPSDEHPHPVEQDRTFNESMYFNVYDPAATVGGWFRIGNRPNQGYAEMTVCLYLPDGSVGFMYARPGIAANDVFAAGGLRFDVVEPFERLRVTYAGQVALLADPLAMRDPKRAFQDASCVDCEVALDYRGLSPIGGGEAAGDDEFALRFARGHYEQHVAARGRIACGEHVWEIDGYGLRDHSWGARSWQAPLWYRWLTCNAGAADGFMVAIVAGRDGEVRRSGVVFENGRYTPILDARIETEVMPGDDDYHQRLRCRARTAERELAIEGRVLSLIPLRNRRNGQTTRICEGLTQYDWDGMTGYGLSEYLDQVG